MLLLSSQHRHTLVTCGFSDCHVGYCLILRVDRPPPEDGSERASFQPVPAFNHGGLSSNRLYWKLETGSRNWQLDPSVTARIYGLKAVGLRLFRV